MPDQCAGNTTTCPICNSIMAATQNERGAFFVCGCCGYELPVTNKGTVEE